MLLKNFENIIINYNNIWNKYLKKKNKLKILTQLRKYFLKLNYFVI